MTCSCFTEVRRGARLLPTRAPAACSSVDIPGGLVCCCCCGGGGDCDGGGGGDSKDCCSSGCWADVHVRRAADDNDAWRVRNRTVLIPRNAGLGVPAAIDSGEDCMQRGGVCNTVASWRGRLPGGLCTAVSAIASPSRGGGLPGRLCTAEW